MSDKDDLLVKLSNLIDTKIDNINQNINVKTEEIKNSISDLKSKISSNTAKIEEVNGRVNDVKTEIDEIKKRLDNIENSSPSKSYVQSIKEVDAKIQNIRQHSYTHCYRTI